MWKTCYYKSIKQSSNRMYLIITIKKEKNYFVINSWWYINQRTISKKKWTLEVNFCDQAKIIKTNVNQHKDNSSKSYIFITKLMKVCWESYSKQKILWWWWWFYYLNKHQLFYKNHDNCKKTMIKSFKWF